MITHLGPQTSSNFYETVCQIILILARKHQAIPLLYQCITQREKSNSVGGGFTPECTMLGVGTTDNVQECCTMLGTYEPVCPQQFSKIHGRKVLAYVQKISHILITKLDLTSKILPSTIQLAGHSFKCTTFEINRKFNSESSLLTTYLFRPLFHAVL